MKENICRWIVIIIGIAILICTIMWYRSWKQSLPSWQLSLRWDNSDSIITVNNTKSENPIYKVIIRGKKIKQPFNRLFREETVSVNEIETIFWDDTTPPGRWTLKIENVKLDIMPARLVVNDSIECEPGENIIIGQNIEKKP
jgi:hypothetical protein